MGDIADMMLEGLLDEETGEYIGDVNRGVYGTESPGFPVSYEREVRTRRSKRHKAQRELPRHDDLFTSCPHCGKRVKSAGLDQHMRAKHEDQTNDR